MLVLLLSLTFNVRFLFQSRASSGGAQNSFSADNSYLFLSPLEATANGKDRIRVTVFVLNAQGIGVLGKTVSLPATSGITVEAVQNVTDNYGRAVFDVVASAVGEYYVDATVDGTKITQGVKLKFK